MQIANKAQQLALLKKKCVVWSSLEHLHEQAALTSPHSAIYTGRSDHIHTATSGRSIILDWLPPRRNSSAYMTRKYRAMHTSASGCSPSDTTKHSTLSSLLYTWALHMQDRPHAQQYYHRTLSYKNNEVSLVARVPKWYACVNELTLKSDFWRHQRPQSFELTSKQLIKN